MLLYLLIQSIRSECELSTLFTLFLRIDFKFLGSVGVGYVYDIRTNLSILRIFQTKILIISSFLNEDLRNSSNLFKKCNEILCRYFIKEFYFIVSWKDVRFYYLPEWIWLLPYTITSRTKTYKILRSMTVDLLCSWVKKIAHFV